MAFSTAFQSNAFQQNAFQIVPPKRGGATYLTPAELRALRRAEEKRRAEIEARDRTIEQAYEDAVHPEIRIAREEAERVRTRRRIQAEQDDEDFLDFLTEHLEGLDDEDPPPRRDPLAAAFLRTLYRRRRTH